MLSGTNAGFTRVYLSRNYNPGILLAVLSPEEQALSSLIHGNGGSRLPSGTSAVRARPAEGTYKAPSNHHRASLAVSSVIFLTDSCKVLRRAAFLVLVGPELSKEADAMGLALGATGEWLAVGSTIQVWEFCIVPLAPSVTREGGLPNA
jgi:hypothetical protein